MSCEDQSCGTGGWTGPQPGDPNNDVGLSANTVYGGINVVWTYPTLNPHAVAHTILYRGLNSTFAQAVQQAVVAGSVYYDKLSPVSDTTYYYWIKLVSINGTTADMIGPVSAIAKPLHAQTLESLTGRIELGVLAQALKTEIARIQLVDARVTGEITNRIAGNAALSALMTTIQTNIDEAITYVQQEIIERTEGDTALVDSLNLLATSVGDNLALFLEEQTIRVDKDTAYAADFTLLFTETGNNTAAIQTEETARTTADAALASQITTVQSTLEGNIASVETSANTQIATLDGKVTAIGALYTVKLSVNGLVGGFGVYNNGQFVEAGFDVDTFWVGRTGPDKVKPFIIDSGIVYLDKARIRNADIGTLKLAGQSVMTGVYDSAGVAAVPAAGTVTLISRTLDLGDENNSGVIVSATVSCSGEGNATVGFKVLINGVVAGDQRASIVGGFGYLFPVAGFANAGASRYVTVALQAYNPFSGPGSWVPFNVTASTIAIMGGKR